MIKRLLFISILFLACGISAGVAAAATLDLAPASANVAVRQTFAVDITVSSPGTAVNAFSGELSYPADKLYVVGVSKADSIVNFWTTEPAAANGTIRFEGVALNPGYSGSGGRIVRVTFRALAEGSATVRFLASSVLANDGLGTSVLTASGTGTYAIKASSDVPVSTPAPSAGLPSAPKISSLTHPDQSSWYFARTAELSWDLPSDVTGVAYVTNAKPSDVPAVSFGRAKGRTTPTLGDGVWYTHVRFRNALGWGPVTDFKTQVDGTEPTDLSIREMSGPDAAAKSLELSAMDALSGVAQFGVSVDGKAETAVPASGAVTSYVTAALGRGDHQVLVKAYDRAGNFVASTISFSITRLDPPTLTDYPKALRDQDFLIVRGTSYPDTDVAFALERQVPVRRTLFGTLIYVSSERVPLDGSVRTDSSGAFVFAYPARLESGLYRISARAVLGDGTRSEPSGVIVIPVKETGLARALHLLLDPTVLVTVLFLLFVGALGLVFHMIRRYHKLQYEAAVAAARAKPPLSM